MKLFISYSLAPTDLQVATLLGRQAQAKGIEVDWSQHNVTGMANLTQVVDRSILLCDFVIAIVSLDSQYTTNVQNELSIGASLAKPSLALVEQGVQIFNPVAGVQYVEFVRHNLGPALAHISRILEGRKNQESTNKWLIGGGLALLALYLISKIEDK